MAKKNNYYDYNIRKIIIQNDRPIKINNDLYNDFDKRQNPKYQNQFEEINECNIEFGKNNNFNNNNNLKYFSGIQNATNVRRVNYVNNNYHYRNNIQKFNKEINIDMNKLNYEYLIIYLLFVYYL